MRVAIVLFAAVAFSAHAADAPVSSEAAPRCEVGEVSNRNDLSAAALVDRAAVFKDQCNRSGGGLVDGDDTRLAHDLTLPGTRSEPASGDFYPPGAARLKARGTAVVAYIVETDGRVSWVAILKSAGNQQLDAMALLYTKSASFQSPAYLEFTPVRIFLTATLNFNLH